MIFARKVWHLLVAIKDGLVLVFMILFFMALYAALTARPSAGMVGEGALLIKLDGSIVEEPSEVDPLSLLIASEAPAREYRARDVVRAIRLAASDDRIKAVVLDLSQFTGAGMVHLQDVGEAIDAVKKAGKPVLTYAVAYADDGVLLAAHASEAWVDPYGGAFVSGPGGYRLYYGALIDRLKITPHVYRVGTYKDFVEPYLGNQASPASKEASQAIYSALWDGWKADLAKARPKARIDLMTSDPGAWLAGSDNDLAKASVASGLIDRIGDKVAFGERVKQLAGADPASQLPGAYRHSRPEALLAAHPEQASGDGVAVVTVAGNIVMGKAGPGTAGGERIARLIDQARADDAKALVLRIDSPGGVVVASEHIRLALERFKAGGRPVAVSMANVAASGGYWVATPGQRIFAEPATITGSIGIFAVLPSFERALASWGVTGDGVRTTPLSGQPDVFTGFTPQVDALLQGNINNGYRKFVALVAASRKRSVEQIERSAEGRVWDGGTARQLGLVDQFGGLDEALAWAAGAAKLSSWHPVYYGTEANPYASLLERLSGGEEAENEAIGGDLAAMLAARQQQQISAAIDGLAALNGTQGAQALCLECPMAPRAAARHDWPEWAAHLAAVLALR